MRRATWVRGLVGAFLALVMLVIGFFAGVEAERNAVLPGSIVREPADAAPVASVFWQSWNLVKEHYVDRTAVEPKRMIYGAVGGMLDSLGDAGHTRFLSPEDLRMEREVLAGTLEGIGAELGIRGGQPIIVAPIPGSPAQRAGVRPGDVIVRVDGREVVGLTIQQIVNLVRGPAGTSVTLTVLHRGDTTLTDITIVRAKITVPNVSWIILPETEVAHVLISQFGERTANQLAAALTDARANGATAIILDLRNNPGGLLNEAVGVASQFLSGGNVLLSQDAQGRRTPYAVQPGGVALDMPVVVLINEGTASSAEIVAGALQDHQRGPLIGITSFGTGTVLSTYPLKDGSAILLGTDEWLTPNGREIWHHGVTPDQSVALPPDAVPLIPNEESGMTAVQLQASQDQQLLTALREITSSASTP